MRCLIALFFSILLKSVQAMPFSVATLMKSSPLQSSCTAVLCDGKLLFQYGVQELRKISGYSGNVLFVWREDGTALLSKKLFDASISAISQEGFPGYPTDASLSSKGNSINFSYALYEYEEDAAVVAFNSSTNTYSILGIIEQGKSLLFGFRYIPIASATSKLSHPSVSWDIVAYSYVAAAPVARTPSRICQQSISSYKAAYAYGCGIGYCEAMGMKATKLMEDYLCDLK